MTEAQRTVAEAILSGPRGGLAGPFNALLRSPEVAQRCQSLGEYIRFDNSVPPILKELAILLTARKWTAQYEWYAHRQFALEAGLDHAVVDAIAAGCRPEGLPADQAAVYSFAAELLATGGVSDEVFASVREVLGEQGAVDLVATIGYYTLVSFVLNVDRYPLPDGVVPLEPLQPAILRR